MGKLKKVFWKPTEPWNHLLSKNSVHTSDYITSSKCLIMMWSCAGNSNCAIQPSARSSNRNSSCSLHSLGQRTPLLLSLTWGWRRKDASYDYSGYNRITFLKRFHSLKMKEEKEVGIGGKIFKKICVSQCNRNHVWQIKNECFYLQNVQDIFICGLDFLLLWGFSLHFGQRSTDLAQEIGIHP